MKNLKKVGADELKDMHDRTCTICYSEMSTAGVLLLCKHVFHQECLRQWIFKNSNHHCPKCKKVFDFEKNDQNGSGVDQPPNRNGLHERLMRDNMR